MADSLVAQQAGFIYQAWLFWERAAKLLLPGSTVAEVTFEGCEVRAFDDIVVRFDPPWPATFGDRIEHEHVQAKYHVGSDGAFTVAALTDPAFIGAKDATLLSRLAEAYRRLGDDFFRRHFWIISPWTFHPDDTRLAELWRDNTKALEIDVLRRGKRRDSQWVRLRAHWRDVMGIDNDDELVAVVRRLRLGQGFGGLHGRFADHVSSQLVMAGLKPIVATAPNEPYGQIPWKLHGQGHVRYTKADLKRIATECELWGAPPSAAPRGRRLGIRTRVEWGEQMEAQAAAFLPLEELFDGRQLRPEHSWTDVYHRIRAFLRGEARGTDSLSLDLGALTTVAFAAGYTMPAKDGLPVFPLQRRRGGADLWDAVQPDSRHSGWTIAQDETRRGQGTELALGLGAARSVWDQMRPYVEAHLPGVRRIVELRPANGLGPCSVAGGGHAVHLATEVESFVRTSRGDGTPGIVHLFIAAPSGLTFFLGQEGERLGRCQLYEFDFPGETHQSYTPSLRVPDHTR